LLLVMVWLCTTAASPGKVRVDPGALPAPFATPSVSVFPAWSPINLARFRLPGGFKINVFAKRLDDPRWLAVAPNGDVFVSEPKADSVVLLRDGDGNGVAEVVRPYVSTGLDRPHGLAFRSGWLYVADLRGVQRFRSAGPKPGSRQKITAVGAFGGVADPIHWTRTIAFSPDGRHFYVGIGATANLVEDKAPYATIQVFNSDGTHQRSFATGLRNPVGLAFCPGTSDLYAVVDERDTLGDGLVPDFLTRVQVGDFLGWPYYYTGSHLQPGLSPPSGLQPKLPDVLFRAHSTPLGLAFYTGQQFPARYRGGAFVALHGSWNASKPQGYMVAFVPFNSAHRPAVYYEPFLTGFQPDSAHVQGRPVGLAVADDGSLLIADDYAGVVWRVGYKP
jgi:glucose/arabinose dehydrogenase